MGPKKKFNIGRDSGRVEARGRLDGLGERGGWLEIEVLLWFYPENFKR